jgi:hypothetical protein
MHSGVARFTWPSRGNLVTVLRMDSGFMALFGYV